MGKQHEKKPGTDLSKKDQHELDKKKKKKEIQSRHK